MNSELLYYPGPPILRKNKMLHNNSHMQIESVVYTYMYEQVWVLKKKVSVQDPQDKGDICPEGQMTGNKRQRQEIEDKEELEGTRERGQGNLSLRDNRLHLVRKTWHTGKPDIQENIRL